MSHTSLDQRSLQTPAIPHVESICSLHHCIRAEGPAILSLYPLWTTSTGGPSICLPPVFVHVLRAVTQVAHVETQKPLRFVYDAKRNMTLPLLHVAY